MGHSLATQADYIKTEGIIIATARQGSNSAARAIMSDAGIAARGGRMGV